jgi:hypothetical protein
MPEIRASAIAIHAEEGNGNPVLVIRDEYGVLRPITRIHSEVMRMEQKRDFFVRGNLKGYGNVLVLEVER